MNMSKLKFVSSGVLSVLVLGAVASDSFAQCACRGGSSQEGSYDSAMSQTAEAEMLLRQVDNPEEMFNLTVIVQDKAIVIVNGEPTYTTGAFRNYVVRKLTPGKTYKFEVIGIFKNETGAEFAAKEDITFKAGESKQVVLNLHRIKRTPPPPGPPAPPAPAPAAPAPAK